MSLVIRFLAPFNNYPPQPDSDDDSVGEVSHFHAEEEPAFDPVPLLDADPAVPIEPAPGIRKKFLERVMNIASGIFGSQAPVAPAAADPAPPGLGVLDRMAGALVAAVDEVIDHDIVPAAVVPAPVAAEAAPVPEDEPAPVIAEVVHEAEAPPVEAAPADPEAELDPVDENPAPQGYMVRIGHAYEALRNRVVAVIPEREAVRGVFIREVAEVQPPARDENIDLCAKRVSVYILMTLIFFKFDRDRVLRVLRQHEDPEHDQKSLYEILCEQEPELWSFQRRWAKFWIDHYYTSPVLPEMLYSLFESFFTGLEERRRGPQLQGLVNDVAVPAEGLARAVREGIERYIGGRAPEGQEGAQPDPLDAFKGAVDRNVRRWQWNNAHNFRNIIFKDFVRNLFHHHKVAVRYFSPLTRSRIKAVHHAGDTLERTVGLAINRISLAVLEWRFTAYLKSITGEHIINFLVDQNNQDAIREFVLRLNHDIQHVQGVGNEDPPLPAADEVGQPNRQLRNVVGAFVGEFYEVLRLEVPDDVRREVLLAVHRNRDEGLDFAVAQIRQQEHLVMILRFLSQKLDGAYLLPRINEALVPQVRGGGGVDLAQNLQEAVQEGAAHALREALTPAVQGGVRILNAPVIGGIFRRIAQRFDRRARFAVLAQPNELARRAVPLLVNGVYHVGTRHAALAEALFVGGIRALTALTLKYTSEDYSVGIANLGTRVGIIGLFFANRPAGALPHGERALNAVRAAHAAIEAIQTSHEELNAARAAFNEAQAELDDAARANPGVVEHVARLRQARAGLEAARPRLADARPAFGAAVTALHNAIDGLEASKELLSGDLKDAQHLLKVAIPQQQAEARGHRDFAARAVEQMALATNLLIAAKTLNDAGDHHLVKLGIDVAQTALDDARTARLERARNDRFERKRAAEAAARLRIAEQQRDAELAAQRQAEEGRLMRAGRGVARAVFPEPIRLIAGDALVQERARDAAGRARGAAGVAPGMLGRAARVIPQRLLRVARFAADELVALDG